MNTNTSTDHWPVNWSGVVVGGLAALAAALITGLASVAVGAQIVGHGHHVVSWNKVQFGGIICTVLSAFFSFVIGGWVAGRITGYTRAETTMLHGAIAWLVAVPCILIVAAIGGGELFGAWYAGLAPAAATLPAADAAAIVRNNALGAITALLLGLIGSVLGGWLASGQPMHFWHTEEHEESGAPAVTLNQPASLHTR
jgi:hypothetical protein